MKYLSLFLIFVCLGCETIIEINPPEYTPEPVATSFFSPDSVWSVTLHSSLGINEKGDTSTEYITDASVRIMDGSNMIEALNYVGNGEYRSNKGRLPVSSTKYTLHVDLPGATSIQATSTAPPPVPFSDYSIEKTGESGGSFGYKTYRLKAVFKDEPNPNFYQIGIYQYRASQYPEMDSLYQRESANELHPGWSCGYVAAAETEIDIEDRGTGCGVWDAIVVTDRNFDGGTYPWSATVEVSETFGRSELLLVLSSLSEEYFEYQRTLEHNLSLDPLLDEPINVYSNVSGGLGVFAGYTNTSVILPFPE